MEEADVFKINGDDDDLRIVLETGSNPSMLLTSKSIKPDTIQTRLFDDSYENKKITTSLILKKTIPVNRLSLPAWC